MRHELSFNLDISPFSAEATMLPRRGVQDPAVKEMAAIRTQLLAALRNAVPTSFEAPDSSAGGNAFTLAVEQLAADIDRKAVLAISSVLGPPPCQNGTYVLLDSDGPVCKDCSPPQPNCHVVDGKVGTSCPKSMRITSLLWAPKSAPNAQFAVQIAFQYGISHA